MKQETPGSSGRGAALLLFLGFSAVNMWLGTAWLLCRGWTGPQHWENWREIFHTIGRGGLMASFLLVPAVVFLWLGWKRLDTAASRRGPILLGLIPAVLLSPASAGAGLLCLVAAPYCLGVGRVVLFGPEVVQSVVSPDGRYEAYVVEAPSIDPPNQTLYVQTTDLTELMYVAKLPEDVDAIAHIHWSPRSDLVVFETRLQLVGMCVPEYQIVKIGNGKPWRRHNPSLVSSFSVGGPWLNVTSVDFPRPGGFRYGVDEGEAAREVDMSFLAPGVGAS